jgi:hypothetical protein
MSSNMGVIRADWWAVEIVEQRWKNGPEDAGLPGAANASADSHSKI